MNALKCNKVTNAIKSNALKCNGLLQIFRKKVTEYYKCITFSVLLVTAVTLCPPMFTG